MRPSPRPARGWLWVSLVAGAVFAVTALVAQRGTSDLERWLYAVIRDHFPKSPSFRLISSLANGAIILPAIALTISLLPRDVARRGVLWVVVLVVASALQGLGKTLVDRARPGDLRAGFPSGHTELAAVYCFMLAYFVASPLSSTALRLTVWAAAVPLVLLVGLARVVVGAHWPLDVLGGAALGLTVVAGGAWWNKRYEPRPVRGSLAGHAPVAWIYRWQTLIPIPFLVALCFTPRLGDGRPRLDVIFDVAGLGTIAAGVLLRLWAALYTGRPCAWLQVLPTQLVTAGPYAYSRHPVQLGNALITIGVVILAESGPGLILMPALLITVFRLAVPYEEQHLATRFGDEYAAYRAQVPRVLRLTAGAGPPRPAPTWQGLTAEVPIVAAAAILAALAEAEEVLAFLQ